MMEEFTLPEVQRFPQNAKFYAESGKDMVEISSVGSPDTIKKRVTPEIMSKFHREWAAYCDGKPPQKRPGISLTELVPPERAEDFLRGNVHNVEEVAALNDMQCQAFGHGTATLRKEARALVEKRRMEERIKAANHVSKMMETVRTPEAAAADEKIAALEGAIAEQGKRMDQLVEAVTALVNRAAEPPVKRGPGRPRKKANGNGAIEPA